VVGRRDAYCASGRSAVTNSLLLSVLWAVGTFGADRNVQHYTGWNLDDQRELVTQLDVDVSQ
jgi:hypothetical protein